MQGIAISLVEINNHRIFFGGIKIFGLIQNPFGFFSRIRFPFEQTGRSPIVLLLL